MKNLTWRNTLTTYFIKLQLNMSFLLLFFFPLTSLATPTFLDVKQALQHNNYLIAEHMLHDVINTYPLNARAHYLYAQILSHNAKFSQAYNEIQIAHKLDPSLSFANRKQFYRIEKKISNNIDNHNYITVKLFCCILLCILLLLGIIIWSIKYCYKKEQRTADIARLNNLKYATSLLNKIQTIKLDLKLSNINQYNNYFLQTQQIEEELNKIIEYLSREKDFDYKDTSFQSTLRELSMQIEKLELISRQDFINTSNSFNIPIVQNDFDKKNVPLNQDTNLLQKNQNIYAQQQTTSSTSSNNSIGPILSSPGIKEGIVSPIYIAQQQIKPPIGLNFSSGMVAGLIMSKLTSHLQPNMANNPIINQNNNVNNISHKDYNDDMDNNKEYISQEFDVNNNNDDWDNNNDDWDNSI